MKKINSSNCAAILAGAALMACASANAQIYFSDNFDSDNGGVAFLNYGTPNQNGNGTTGGGINTTIPNWTVTSGSVDLIGYTGASGANTGGGGDYDFLPGNGLYIDMDGTTLQNGTITSKGISLPAGTYALTFSLANSQRNQADSTEVSITGTSADQTFDTPAEADGVTGFQTETIDFTVPSGGETVNLVFADTTIPGNDNFGALLDNVVVTGLGVPDGQSTAVLVGMVSIGLGALRRRLNRA